MKIPTKTLKSGFSLPVYGLGTWEMGGRWQSDGASDELEVQAIKAAIDHGITHIDTAESYAAGHAEELVGQAIKGYDRAKLIIATKVSAEHQAYDDLLRSFAASLHRLDTNYVDLYLLHRFPEVGINIKDTMRAMDRLVQEGVLKHIGVCNMTPNRLKATQAETKNQVVYNQLHYALDCREPVIRGAIAYCQDNDIFISAWGPLSKGNLERAPILDEIAKKYNKTPYQVAINWLIVQKNVITIPKTSHVEHLEENLGALGWELSKEDQDRLTKDFPSQMSVSNRVPLDYAADVAP